MKNNLTQGLVQLFIFIVCMGTSIVQGQTTLTDGDVTFTGINGDNPDGFSFVCLVDIDSSTTIYFTNEYWSGSAFQMTGSTILFTAKSFISAGEEINLNIDGQGISSTSGTVSGNLAWQYSSSTTNFIRGSGDNIMAFQGSVASPNFISAITSQIGENGTSGNAWQTAYSLENTTLPSGKINGQNGYLGLFPFGSTEYDNAHYKSTALHTGDRDTLLTGIMDLSNWEFDDANVFGSSTTPFVVPGSFTASITTQNNIDCNGASIGSLTATATDGLANFKYVWSNGDSTANTSSTTNTITNLTVGTYTVTITDGNGDTSTASSTITQPTVLVALASVSSTLDCNGDLDGEVTASATGGTTPYTYSWQSYSANVAKGGTASSSGHVGGYSAARAFDGFSTIWRSSQQNNAWLLYDLGAGNGKTISKYSVQNGVGAGPADWIFEGSNNNSSWTPLDTIENQTWSGGGTKSFTISNQISYRYYRFSGINFNSHAGAYYDIREVNMFEKINQPSLVGLGAGTYYVTITDANGCYDSASVTMTEPAALVASVTVDSNVTCNGNADGGITALVTGGVTPYSYLWSNATTAASITSAVAGSYTVTITDANGCTAIDSSTVTEQLPLVANNPIANIVRTISGNWGGWLNANSQVVEGNPSRLVFTGLSGTTSFSSWTKFDISSIEPDATVDSVVLELYLNNSSGVSQMVNINQVSPSNYGPYVSFNSAAYSDFQTNTYTSTNVSGQGVYSNINLGATAVADLEAALGSGQFQLAFDIPLPSSYKAFTSDLNKLTVYYKAVPRVELDLCVGGNPGVLDTLKPATGGSGSYTYVWQQSSNGSLWSTVSGKSDSSLYDASFTHLDTTTYRRITIDEACGDSVISTSIVANVPDSIKLSAYVNNISCNGMNTGAIGISVSGGAAPFNYSWSNASTSSYILGLTAGTYTVTVTDDFGCARTDSFSITEPAVLAALTTVGHNISCNGNSDGELSGSATGGTTPFTYSWSNGGTTASQSGMSAGTYTVTITDSKGCTSTSSKTITSPAVLDAGKIY